MYRLLAENGVDCIWQMNSDLEFIYINPAIFHQFGFTPEEWMKGKLSEHCSSKEMKKIENEVSDAMDRLPDKITYSFESSFFHKDGHEIPCEVIGKILLYDAGDFIGFQGTTRNITERKQAQSVLEENEQRLKTILDSIQTGIVIITAETHKIIDVNPAAVEMIGASKEQIIGRVCHKYICPSEKGNCPITDLGQKIDHSERILLTAKGKKLSILKTVCQITLNGQKCLLDSFIDITEKKQLEVQLQQSQKMEVIGTLAGGIAHDFNNILFPIIGYTEMLLEDASEDSQLKKDLTQIFNGASRASDLVKQILTFSRQENYELKPLKTQQVIKEALKLIASSLPSTIKISQNINKNCGMILADSTQIHQVIMNLCTNAFHAMEETGGELKVNLKEIELTTEDLKDQSMIPGMYVCLTVRDTGTGIKQSIIDRIFDPYFTTKEEGRGTGLGLAVMHGIVKTYKGHISVYSELENGTEFRVYLPMIEKLSESAQNKIDSSI